MFSLALLSIVLFGSPAFAQLTSLPTSQSQLGPAVHFKQADVDTSVRTGSVIPLSPLASGIQRFVMQLDGAINADRRARLVASGVVLEDYLPDHAYIVKLDKVDQAAFAKLGFVRWISPFRKEWKMDPSIDVSSSAPVQPTGLAQQSGTQVVAVLFAGEAPGPAVAQLQAAGAVVLGRTLVGRHWMIDARVSAVDVTRLTDIASVQFVGRAPVGALRNDTNEWIVQSNQSGQTPLWDAGLHGEGQMAGLIDGTILESHCDFDDTQPIGPTHRKIVALRNPLSPDGHGTHVAGTLAGDAGIVGQPDPLDGLALASKISFSEVASVFFTPSTLIDRLMDAHNDGARVHSNSWGDDGTTAYTIWSQQIDQFSYDFEDDLVVFAVSNGASLKTPENAKNVLAVGASLDAPSQGSFCSGGVGPTTDGRRKPEIYAPGCVTHSADVFTSCGTVVMGGTSMACPVVAGAGLLVRQYFVDGYYPDGLAGGNSPLLPSGALMKAVLINGTADMTGIPDYPSDLEGWGRLLLDDSLFFPGDPERLFVVDVRNANGLTTGQATAYVVPVLDSSVPFRITLGYSEPPASINAADAVVNNLDLDVVAPDGQVYRGNWFAGGESVAGGVADARNNVERVILSAPLIGNYTVTVRGTAVNQAAQGYALVVNGALSPDCNRNGVPDLLDISMGTSPDCNGNGVPDECDPDCNGDGTPDDCQIAACPILEVGCPDCNGNGTWDRCDLDAQTSWDCNTNLVPDECDITTGSSTDINGDGIPDECCLVAVAVTAEANPVSKNRYISIMPGNAGIDVAIRVTISASGLFPGSVGVQRWVGVPDPVSGIAPLQCTPQYRDWGTDPATIHVGAQEIAPDTTYAVEAIGFGCDLADPLSFAGSAMVSTAASWGDVVGVRDSFGWTPPNGIVNGIDVTSVLTRFRLLSIAPPLVRVDVDPAAPNGSINGNDIQRVVLAFQNGFYPFAAPKACVPP